jgi:phage terminase large subunit
VRKAKNDVVDGIRETAVAMKTGAIKIAPTTKNLITELQGYVWDDKLGDEAPLKENDHACDAMRYFVKTMRIVNEIDRKAG